MHFGAVHWTEISLLKSTILKVRRKIIRHWNPIVDLDVFYEQKTFTRDGFLFRNFKHICHNYPPGFMLELIICCLSSILQDLFKIFFENTQ